MATTALNVGCGGLVTLNNQDSDIAHMGPSSLAMATPKTTNIRLTTTTTTRVVVDKNKNNKGFGKGGSSSMVYEKLDDLMKQSVVEIVKNLRQAPLLLHLHNGPQTTTFKSVEEDSWLEGINSADMAMPEALIFVDQLQQQQHEEDDDENSSSTREWGIVVQGRGCPYAPLCYLLKTTSGASAPGLAFCSTHFCLTRVQSFTQTAASQLNDCWLA